jgi:hypothetical protein
VVPGLWYNWLPIRHGLVCPLPVIARCYPLGGQRKIDHRKTLVRPMRED